MTTKEKVTKIFEAILEELNGYTKQDAQREAPDNECSELWDRIEKIVSNNKCEHSWYRTTKNYEPVKKCSRCGQIKRKLFFKQWR